MDPKTNMTNKMIH